MEHEMKNLLEGAAQMGILLPEGFEGKMETFLSELLRWNSFMNLTAITDWDEMIQKHCLDSLSLLQTEFFEEKKTVADVGCGAGFPSMPLKLARPELRFTLIDSVNKKLNFLREAVETLGLSNVSCVHGRAEELARGKTHREHYDVVTARAVATLPALCEYCLPLCKVGGVFLAMKGPAADEELETAQEAIRLLGGEFLERREVLIPGTNLTHNILVIKKAAPTPGQYPRQGAKIATKPL